MKQLQSILTDLENKAITKHQAYDLILVLFDVSVELPELCSQCFRRNVNNDKVCKCGKPFKGN